jgi:hypothetical protein
MARARHLLQQPGAVAHLPLLGVVLLVLALWSPSWHRGVEGDFAGHVALLSTLAHPLVPWGGWPPLWTADWNAGSSLLLLYLHPLFSLALLSPFVWLFGPALGLHVGGSVLIAVAAAAMYAWCRRFAGSQAGALLAAALYALSPGVFAMAGHEGQAHQPVTLALVPLLFLAWTRLAERPDTARVVAAAVTTAALFLDMQRFAIVFPFALAVYAALSLARLDEVDGRPLRRTLRAALLAGGAVAGAAALVCFPALPALVESGSLQWHRPGLLEVYRRAFSLPHVFALLDRAGAVTPLLDPLPSARSSAVPGQWYQGLVALAVAAAGVALATLRPRAPVRRGRLALAIGLGGSTLLLALGVHPLLPHHAAIAREWWAGDHRGAPALLLATSLALAAIVFAAFALATPLWNRLRGSRGRLLRGRAGVALGVLLALGVVGCIAPFEWLVHLVPGYGRIRAPAHFAFPLLPFWLATVVALSAPAWEGLLRTPRRLAIGLCAVLALHTADVLPYALRLSDSRPGPTLASLREGFRSLRDGPEGRILASVDYAPLADLLAATEARRPSAWSWLSWASEQRTGDLVFRGIHSALDVARRGGPAGPLGARYAAELAGMADVRYLVDLGDAPLPDAPELPVVQRSGPLTVYENRHARPYVQLYPRLALVSGGLADVLTAVVELGRVGVAAATLSESDGNEPPFPAALRPDFYAGERAGRIARRIAHEGQGVPMALPARRARALPDATPDAAAPCDVEARTTREVSLRCRLARDGYLVIAESWSPRWSVRVDGEERPLLRLSHAFQGVAVAAGDEHVEFRYLPSRLVAVGLLVSALAWCAAAAALLRHRWRTT